MGRDGGGQFIELGKELESVIGSLKVKCGIVDICNL